MAETNVTLQEILKNVKIIRPFVYIGLVVCGTIIIRLILTFLKAMAIENGEIDDSENTKNTNGTVWKNEEFKDIFSASFCSKGKDIRIDDYWLPALIGLAELFIYPLLMTNGYWTAIGAWIIIKTASSWGGWQKTRTAYNRFLLGNILSLSCSGIIAYICF